MIYDASVESQLTFQRPATLIMEEIIELHHDIFSLLLFLCTLVFYLLFIIVYKFSSTNLKVKRDFFFKSQATLEIIWTLIPMLIVLSVLYPSFAILYSMDLDPSESPLITVKVIGHQWYWTYELAVSDPISFVSRIVSFDSYMLADDDLPNGSFRLLEVDNRLQLPVNILIRVLITSTDVLHSWAVPSFGIKVDACPGRFESSWSSYWSVRGFLWTM